MPGQFVKRLAFRVSLASDDRLVLVERDGPLLAKLDGWPLFLGDHGPGQPAHVEGEVVNAPEIEIGRNGAFLQDVEEVFGAGFEDHPVADAIEGVILDGGPPAMAGVVVLCLDDLVHHELPRSGGGGGIARFPIDAGQLETEGGMLFALILGVNQAKGFLFVGGGEGFLLAGLSVFAVVNAPAPPEGTVTILHVPVHVVSMNQLADAPLASSGRAVPE